MRRFYIDLDPETPTVKYIDGDDKESALFVMKKGETEAFLLVAAASRDRHEWTVSIPCLVDGVAVQLSVRGEPLVTVGPEGVTRYLWGENGGWVRSTD